MPCSVVQAMHASFLDLFELQADFSNGVFFFGLSLSCLTWKVSLLYLGMFLKIEKLLKIITNIAKFCFIFVID